MVRKPRLRNGSVVSDTGTPSRSGGEEFAEQCGELVTLAFTVGTDFRLAKRVNRDQVLHWNTW
jgi:hypothetical protein